MKKATLLHKTMLKGKIHGYCQELENGKIEIAISERKSTNALYYFQTFVHECLHWAFTLMKKKYKTKISMKKEHKLIEEMERAIAIIFTEALLTPKKKFKRKVKQNGK